jgi:hypothetical protein
MSITGNVSGLGEFAIDKITYTVSECNQYSTAFDFVCHIGDANYTGSIEIPMRLMEEHGKDIEHFMDERVAETVLTRMFYERVAA